MLDSGATGTFVASSDAIHLQHSVPISNGPTVLAANGNVMRTTSVGQLPLSPFLSSAAQSAYVIDELQTGTLISLGQLCDDDVTAVFSKTAVNLLKNNEIIITGKRLTNGLWSIPLATSSIVPTIHQANGILRLDLPKQELAVFHHVTLGSPVVSTLLRAIRRGHLLSFPGLTSDLITKHLPKSVATVLGHQDQEARNIRSTRPKLALLPALSEQDTVLDNSPSLEPRSHHICATILHRNDVLKSYSDQTGQFPIPSSSGNNYMFILYHQDTNTIHAVGIPNRKGPSIRDAWESTHRLLLHRGHAPELHILDNECSLDLKIAFLSNKIAFQRVPPHEHRVNAAERAIRTFKNHFIASLCTVDTTFPMTEWDRLLPQVTLTLNLLRSSRIHPTLSAHASLHGNFDYNKTPIAPIGTRVIAHVTADKRPTFGVHGHIGWYIGPSMEHYRCYKCYFEDTRRERDLLKVDFFPQKFPFPRFSTETYLKQTAEDMLHLLRTTPTSQPTASNPLLFGPSILNAFREVAEILGRAIPPLPPPIHVPLPPPIQATTLLPSSPTIPPPTDCRLHPSEDANTCFRHPCAPSEGAPFPCTTSEGAPVQANFAPFPTRTHPRRPSQISSCPPHYPLQPSNTSPSPLDSDSPTPSPIAHPRSHHCRKNV